MEKSIEEILEEYKDIVRAKAGLYFLLGAEKDDLIQEGMIGLVKAYNSYDASKGASFKTFAELCISREMITAVKRASRLKYAPLNEALSLDAPVGLNDAGEEQSSIGDMLTAGPGTDPEASVVFGELWSYIFNNEDGYFSETEKQVIKGLYNGLGYRQIAVALGKTPKQIDNAIQRIKTKIKKLMA